MYQTKTKASILKEGRGGGGGVPAIKDPHSLLMLILSIGDDNQSSGDASQAANL